MDKNRVAGKWHQLRGKVKEQWGKLTNDDLKQVEGHAEQIVGKLQQLYGLGREQAEDHIKKFRRPINPHRKSSWRQVV